MKTHADKIALVTELVSLEYKLSTQELLLKSGETGARRENLVWPRQIAMYLLRTSGMTLEATGKAFGRDHGTVMHACERVNARIDTEPETKDAIKALTARFYDLLQSNVYPQILTDAIVAVL